MATDLDDWFVRSILCHEAALTRYLRRNWHEPGEVSDLRQEVYARVYEAAARNRPAFPKSFLFATARRLLIDRVRRSRVVAIDAVGDIEGLNVFIDEQTPDRHLDAHQSLKRLIRAFDALPARCREIVWLRKVEQLAQREIAIRLGIREKTVENQIAKGSRMLAAAFFGMDEPPTMNSGKASLAGFGNDRVQARRQD